MMLVVHFTKEKPEVSRSGKIKEESILVYESGYYIGAISNKCPHGKGSFSFSYQKLKSFTIKGEWKQGAI